MESSTENSMEYSSHGHGHGHEPHDHNCGCDQCADQHSTGAEDYSSAGDSSKPFYDWDQAAQQITRWEAKWDGGNYGTAADVTFSFGQADGSGNFSFTQSARDMAFKAFELISEVADITFTWADEGTGVADSENGELVLRQYGTSFYGGGVGGWGGSIGGNDDLYTINSGFASLGGENLSLFLHEIGHAIGLSHPGDYDGGGSNYADDAVFWNDTEQYTVMSYWNSANTGSNVSTTGTADALLLYDIASLQHLYGANQTTRTGDTVYGFNSNAGDTWDLNSGNDDIVAAVWDAGGIDTLDLSGFSSNSDIDLREEAFSSFGGLTKNFSIAKAAVIENALGGSGNDTIVGNSASNTLNGGGGIDRLDGRQGADTLDGGLGSDVYYVDNVGDTIINEIAFSSGGGIDTVYSSIDFTFTNGSNLEVLRLQGTADRATGSDAQENIVGNTTLSDILSGNGGSDTINGKGGDDFIDGGVGADTLIGEAGNDIFYYGSFSDSQAGASTRDFINSFSHGSDRISLSDIDANPFNGGDQAFEFIGSAAFDGDGFNSAGQVRYFTFDNGDFNIVEADWQGDGIADLQIFVNGTDFMTESDFIL